MDTEISAERPRNNIRRSTKVLAALGGSSAGVTLGVVFYLIQQATTPINRDLARLETTIVREAGITRKEISDIKLDLLSVMRTEREAQYRIDSHQDERIRELVARANRFKGQTSTN